MKVLFSVILFYWIIPFSLAEEMQEISVIYENIDGDKPSFEVFEAGAKGYFKYSGEDLTNKKKSLLTVIDFTLPSTEKRLWVIDMKAQSVTLKTYVSHGRNSGYLYAKTFSNTNKSYQSSLGFYITGDTYIGRNGFSLYLDGMEKGINDNARERAIVMHGAWYANESMIKTNKRLGRSYGCPAVPESIHKELIKLISDKTVLFIYHDDPEYFKKSGVL